MLLGSCHKDLPGLSSPKETNVKRWLALLGCVLGVTACSDHSQPTGPNPQLGLLDGSIGGQIGQIPQLSGVMVVEPNFVEPTEPGIFDVPSLSAPNVGTNVAMNQDLFFAPQDETPISVDPNNPQRLFGGANDYRNGDAQCGVYASSNGGASWNDVGGGTTLGPGTLVAGDPSTAFGPDGAAYSVCIGFDRGDPTTSIYVSRSTDLQTIQFRGFVVFDLLGGNDPTFEYINDKPFVAVDTRPGSPYVGRIYVSWTRFKFNRITGAYIESPIVLSYSDNGGLTWIGPNRVGSPTQNIDQGSVPTPGPDGQVYVVFENYTGGTKAMVAASLDGGNTFAAAVKVDDIYEIPFPLKNSHYRGNSFPSIAGCTSGNLYVVWGDYRRGNADARFSRSVDGGLTWEPSFIVNSDLSTADHFFPWITSSPDNGLVHVAFLQRDDTPNNRLYNTWLATSTDLGASFGTQVLVSSGPSDPLFDGFGGFFIGDYIGVAGIGQDAHPAWTDTRGIGCRGRSVCFMNADAVTATVSGF